MKKILALGAVGMLAVSALAGCGSSGGKSATPAEMEGNWVLKSGSAQSGPVNPFEETPIELNIESDGAFNGTVGCNNMIGTVKAVDGGITLAPVASTMMFCEGMMEAETAYGNALDAVTSGTVSKDQLVLKGDGVELNFARK